MSKELLKQLNDLKADGLVVSREHPILPLTIWNYSKEQQCKRHWSDFMKRVRGMVTDPDGNIIAKGFDKFDNIKGFNLNVHGSIYASEKMDGTYIQLFHYKDEWVLSTKGAFINIYTAVAKSILYSDYPQFEKLPKTLTYCFELIHPETKVVVDYWGKRDLFFLGQFANGMNGVEDNAKFQPKKYALNVPDKYKFRNKNELLEHMKKNPNNREGLVLNIGGTLVKAKFENYLRLHALVTETNSYRVWETLQCDTPVSDFLESTPDEFYEWYHKVKDSILSKRFEILSIVAKEAHDVIKNTPKFTESELYHYCMDETTYQDLTHMLITNKMDCLSDTVWELVKPELKTPYHNNN